MQFKRKLLVKPVSVNEAWQLKGFRKFKSKKYNDYQKIIYSQLEDTKWPFEVDKLLQVKVKVGFSNKLSDLDNALKPLFDTLSSHYGWNDNKIYFIATKKLIVPKGKEYIDVEFKIYPDKLS